MTGALFISDTSDGGNWGCYATSGELRAILNEKINITNTVFLNETGVSNKKIMIPSRNDIRYIISGCKASINDKEEVTRRVYDIGRCCLHLFEILPKTVNQFKRRAKEFMESDLVNKYFGDIKNIDHVIINGEGSIHDSGVTNYRNRSWSLLFLAYIAKKELGMKTHIINHTLEINTDRFQSIVDLVYPLMDSIIFRDPVSMSEYETKTNYKNGIQAADAAWLVDNNIRGESLNEYNEKGIISLWHPSEKNPKFDFSQPYICIGGGSGLQRSTNIKSKIFISLINKIQTRFPNTNILLTAASGSDETFMLNVSEDTGECLLKLNNNHLLAASILADSELYLGGRWHESIFALLGESQLISFSGNTFKMEALKKQIGSNYPIYSESDIQDNTSDILDSVSEGINNGFYDQVPTENMQSLALKNASII